MLRRRLLLALLATGCLLPACVNARGTWRTSKTLSPIPAGEPVPLYLAATSPQWVRNVLAPYAESAAAAPWGALPVAEMEAKVGTFGSWGTAVNGVRDSARASGADTIVASGTSEWEEARIVFFRLLRRADY